MNAPKVICLRSDAFYELLDTVIERINEVHGLSKAERWISGEECMKILNIKSKTTLWDLKSQGKIAFSRISQKNVLYDRFSVLDYIHKNKEEAF